MRPRRFPSRAALTLVTASAAAALSVAVAQAPPTGYLTPGDLDGTTLLGPPPPPGSPRDVADHRRFEETRALAGTPRWALAIEDDNLRTGVVHRFSCAVGVSLSPKTTPRTLAMLRRIDGDVRTFGTPPKDYYGRRRPALESDAPVCVPRADWMRTNASYPSGHAMLGWSWALVLSELAPARADVLLRSGRDFGDSRAICGVHFQSDVDAGRLLGSAMVARLHAAPAFLADEAAARIELRHAARRNPPPTDCAEYG